MTNPEADRRELTARLLETVTNYRKWQFVVVPSVRRDMIDAAFDAMADIGTFNRQWPDMRITPIPE